MKQALTHYWRYLAIAAAIYVGVTVIVEFLLSRFPGEWFAATQVSTSLLLVFVTWWYVSLTGRMVSVQQSAPKDQLQLQAAAQLIKLSLKSSLELASLTSLFPIDLAKGKRGGNWAKAINELIDFQAGLLEQGALLRDTALAKPISQVSELANTAASRVLALARAIETEDEARNKDKRAWSWESVKRTFNADVRPKMSETRRCEWDDLIEGKYLHQLATDMTHLQRTASSVAIRELT